MWALGVVLVVATGLRFLHLGRPSLWYDEVVTMRLARTAGPAELLRLLAEIDATRAPLHPLLLQVWLRLAGPSDWSGRAFSALCGVAVVALVYAIGREARDRRAGLWGAWLAALCPALARYSQEVRMYEFLTLVTCVAWWLVLRTANSGRTRLVPLALATTLTALVHTHPLGLFMLAALGPAWAFFWRQAGRSWSSWLLWQVLWLAATLPWLPHYLDHPPESVVGRLPPRFLLGLPIEFIGGNFLGLGVALTVIAAGALVWKGPRAWPRFEAPPAWWAWVAWFAVPPTLLYIYSWIGHPIFGPARYTIFVAPAYLLLVARGLARLHWFVASGLALGAGALSVSLLTTMVYTPDLKADWRAAAREIERAFPQGRVIVAVASADPARNVEVETARYYLADRCEVVPAQDLEGSQASSALVFATGTRGGGPVATVPDWVAADWSHQRLPGLLLYSRPGPSSP